MVFLKEFFEKRNNLKKKQSTDDKKHAITQHAKEKTDKFPGDVCVRRGVRVRWVGRAIVLKCFSSRLKRAVL